MAEIAGLVLAAPPLMISFLEHYRECLQVYGCWAKFAGEHRKSKTQVQLLKLRIDLLWNKLLLPVVDSEEELETLKQDRKKLKARLQIRLNDLHETYSDALDDLQDALTTLSQTLTIQCCELKDLIAKQKGTFIDRIQGRTQHELLRLKFSTSQKPREDAMTAVKDQLEGLTALLQFSDEDIEAKAAMRQRISTSQHKPLLTFWKHAQRLHKLVFESWTCQCLAHHCADLQLTASRQSKVRVHIDFVYSQDRSPTHSWTRIAACLSQYDAATSTGAVRFDGNQPQLTEINDMCQALHITHDGSKHEGILQDDYKIALDGQCTRYLSPKDMISLQDLFLDLNRRQRYQLAVTIASSHIQLHFSPWLSTWNMTDILFKVSSAPELDRPYLRHKFADTQEVEHSFASLGILLLELCFGKLLVSDQRHEEAWRWLDNVEGETGEEYAHAVEWCLGKARVRPDSDWRTDFYANVLANLEKVVAAQWPAKP